MKLPKPTVKRLDFDRYKVIIEQDGQGVCTFKADDYIQIGVYEGDKTLAFQFDLNNADHIEALKDLYRFLGEL